MAKQILTPTNKLRKCTKEMSAPVVLLSCGSFSPVTNMHIRMLESAKRTLEALGHTVLGGYFSPVHTKYNKPSLVSSEARIQMLRLATQSSEWMMVDPWEAEQEKLLPSHAVAEHLTTVLANAEQSNGCNLKIVFVCGADLVQSMLDPEKWPLRNVHRLLRSTTLAVHPRADVGDKSDCLSDEAGKPVTVIKIDGDVNPVSSTRVRNAILAGQPISHLVHEDVERYIQSMGLFSN